MPAAAAPRSPRPCTARAQRRRRAQGFWRTTQTEHIAAGPYTPRAQRQKVALAQWHCRRARQRIDAQPSGGAGRGERGTRPLRRMTGAGPERLMGGGSARGTVTCAGPAGRGSGGAGGRGSSRRSGRSRRRCGPTRATSRASSTYAGNPHSCTHPAQRTPPKALMHAPRPQLAPRPKHSSGPCAAVRILGAAEPAAAQPGRSSTRAPLVAAAPSLPSIRTKTACARTHAGRASCSSRPRTCAPAFRSESLCAG